MELRYYYLLFYIFSVFITITNAEGGCENGYEEVLEAGKSFIFPDNNMPIYLGDTAVFDTCRDMCNHNGDCFGFFLDNSGEVCNGLSSTRHVRDDYLLKNAETKNNPTWSRTMFTCINKCGDN